ncbi:MAG: hypothetical protein ACR2RE_06860, partial [Geminicoccaceae bacterium]
TNSPGIGRALVSSGSDSAGMALRYAKSADVTIGPHRGATVTMSAQTLNLSSTLTMPWDSLVGDDPDAFWDPAEPQQFKIPTGKGIRKVRVHAHLDIEGATIASTAQLFLTAHKNGDAEFPGTGRVACEVGFTNQAPSLHSGVIDVVDGDILTVAGQFGSDSSVTVASAGSYFQIEVVEAAAGAASPQATAKLPRNYIDGLILANGIDADHEITIASGQAYATNDGATIDLTAPLTIDIEEAGDRIGATVLAANTTYHVLIGISGGSPIACFADTAELGNGLPPSWSSFRRVGSVLTDGSSNIRGFTQINDTFLLDDPSVDNINTVGSSQSSITITVVPTGVRVRPMINVGTDTANGEVVGGIVEQSLYTPGKSSGWAFRERTGDGRNQSFVSEIYTDTNGQIAAQADAASRNFVTTVMGWIDCRGRE